MMSLERNKRENERFFFYVEESLNLFFLSDESLNLDENEG